MRWRWVKTRWLNNAQTQRHRQPTPPLPKSLGESTCTREKYDGNICRLVSAFDYRLNVADSNPLGYTFNHSFRVLSWKVLWTSGKLHPSASETIKTTTTNFSKESKYLKRPEKFFQVIPVPKFIQGFSKYAFYAL